MCSKVSNETVDIYKEIRQVLCKFQIGYAERNLEKVEEFVEELFIEGPSTYVVGTGTNELFLGSNKVKELIRGDWEGWGDVCIDCDNPHVEIQGGVAWFATTGSVKYTFEDSPEKYDRYVEFIKSRIEDNELTPRQKIAFVNWVLALSYHKRPEEKREYLWPMRLSGVLIKSSRNWKFANLKFSMTNDSFPDERFEHSKEYLEIYNQRNSMTNEYENNKMNMELKKLFKEFEKEFFGQKDINKELMNRYFGVDSRPYIVGIDNKLYHGIEQVQEFFSKLSDTSLSLDMEHAIASEAEGVTWVTLTGVLNKQFTEEQLCEKAVMEVSNLLKSDLTAKSKIFSAHRKVAYILKESASGINHTYAIRLSAVISKDNIFKQIHFSVPFYWIIEGKVDSI
jgi:hypothetical protein